MKRIEREDQRPGTVTYQLDDGRYVTLEENAVQQFGADNLIEWLGIEPAAERVPVMQHGRRVGTLPADFDPLNAGVGTLRMKSIRAISGVKEILGS